MSGAPVISPRLPWEELAAIAPLRPAVAADAICGLLPQYVAEPRSAEAIAGALRWAHANQVAVAARGGGSKLEWGNRLRHLDLVISTSGLNRVVEHAFDDMIATVEPGCTMADFQRQLAQHGQRLALDPLFPERATVGGVLATNDSGGLRLRFGSMRDLIIGITVALPDGTLARSGGKVVKNVAGYDLPKLFTGSLGTLGIIAQATFRLHPRPAVSETCSAVFDSARSANQFMQKLLDSTLVPAAIQLRTGRGRSLCVDVRYEGIPAGVAAQIRRTEAMGAAQEAAQSEVWQAREELWMRSGTSCLCKFSVLPADLAGACDQIDQIASELQLDWLATAQATGIGQLRWEGEADKMATALRRLRGRLERNGGSLAVLRCPDEWRSRMDAWGDAGSALALMRRVKRQFDPAGILNPGRFVGGI
jgi:glycolate oxidase FAD binding subunit